MFVVETLDLSFKFAVVLSLFVDSVFNRLLVVF
jgi:hypothetical protein